MPPSQLAWPRHAYATRPTRRSRHCIPRADQIAPSGDEGALKLAVQHLVADGPASAVTLAAADVRLDATRTTAPSGLALLQHGGDLLDEETADRTVDWLLAALKDPTSFVKRTSALYVVELRLVETLAALAAHPNAQKVLVDHVIALSGQQDQMMAISWARVVRALPDEAWNAETARSAGQKAIEFCEWRCSASLPGTAAMPRRF